MFTFKFLNMSSDNRSIFVMNYESRTKCSNNICFFYYHNGWLTCGFYKNTLQCTAKRTLNMFSKQNVIFGIHIRYNIQKALD